MTNFEKMKTMDEKEFAAAIAAVVASFRTRTDRYYNGIPIEGWCLAFADWFRGFANAQYNDAFESPEDHDILIEVLGNIFGNRERRNPFKEDGDDD